MATLPLPLPASFADGLAAELARALVATLDVDEIARALDVQDVFDRLDVDRIAARLDVDAILARVDMDAVLARVDVDALLARADVDALVARADLDPIVDRLDVDALVDRVDPNRFVAGLDVQAFAERLDLRALLRDAAVAELLSETVSRTAFTPLRRNVARVDLLVERLLAKLLRQDRATWPRGVALDGEPAAPTDPSQRRLEPGRRGAFAGPFARVAAAALDVAGIVGSWVLVTTSVLGLLSSVFGIVEVGGGGNATRGIAWTLGLLAWGAAWLTVPTVFTGRSPAMGVLGLRIVRDDGTPLTARRTAIRQLLEGVTTLLLAVTYVPVLVDRRRRALHDRLVGSVVVFDDGRHPPLVTGGDRGG